MARVFWTVTIDTAERATQVRRQFVRFLRQYAPRSTQVFEAELVFGELLSNIARHEPGPVKIVVDVVGDEAIVTLDGPSPDEGDEAAAPPAGLSESGRGLYLIRTLSRDYYVDRGPRGHTTTIVLGLRQLQAV
ncbi:MAG TPA: ATP-binding protein [Candidatus Baltobacteraceae bacterium]|nr:ATP-binding protein [Candidatus Baltobacteraceae bacterium]